MFRLHSALPILRGILAVAIGIAALAWPDVTVLALALIFAVNAFLSAGIEGVRAFTAKAAGPVVLHLLLALTDFGAGIVAATWPGPTALVLVFIMAAWALLGGVVEIIAASRPGLHAGTRARFLVGGLLSGLFGLLLAGHPRVGALSVALLFGLYNLAFGASQIVLGIGSRRTGQAEASPARRPGGPALPASPPVVEGRVLPFVGPPMRRPHPDGFELRARIRPGAPAVVTVRGEVDIATAPFQYEVLLAASRLHGPEVVVDLGDVTFIDTAGINALLAVLREVRFEGGSMQVIRSSPQVRRIVALLGLTDALGGDEEKALA